MKRSKIETEILSDLMAANHIRFKLTCLKTDISYSVVNLGTQTKCDILERLQDEGLIRIYIVNPNYAFPSFVAVAAKDAKEFSLLENVVCGAVRNGDFIQHGE